MASSTAYYTPRILLTIAALITAIVPYIADFNETHVYNPEWPGMTYPHLDSSPFSLATSV